MNSTIVIYKSVYGYTKTYAEMISEELKCELREADSVKASDLEQYDTIIYGGGMYAIGINGIKLITDNFEKLEDKNLIVWATGSNPGRKEDVEEVWKHNFTEEQRKKIKTFYLRGGFDYSKLNAKHKYMMSLLKVKLKSTKERNEDEQGLLNAYETLEYHCKKENADELISYVRENS